MRRDSRSATPSCCHNHQRQDKPVAMPSCGDLTSVRAPGAKLSLTSQPPAGVHVDEAVELAVAVAILRPHDGSAFPAEPEVVGDLDVLTDAEFTGAIAVLPDHETTRREIHA